MTPAALTSRYSCHMLHEAHRSPLALRRAPVPLLCYLRPSATCQRLQLSTRRSRGISQRGKVSVSESAGLPSESLDQSASSLEVAGGSSATDSQGTPIKDDGKVMVTFRWPAALGGQDISVVGACTSSAAPEPLWGGTASCSQALVTCP